MRPQNMYERDRASRWPLFAGFGNLVSLNLLAPLITTLRIQSFILLDFALFTIDLTGTSTEQNPQT